MRRSPLVSVLLLVVAVGLGVAVAAGAFSSAPTSAPTSTPAAAPTAARVDGDATHPVPALPQDDPISALMRRVLIGGELGTITPASASAHTIGIGAAERSALAGMPVRGHSSRVLGAALAYVTEPGLGQDRLMWLVSVDLPGGLTNPGGPDSATLGLDNYIVGFVDAKTGRWVMTSAGHAQSLPSLPFIRG